MQLSHINENGLVLLGCGKMGSAMLQGWLADGVIPSAVTILDPYPSDWVKARVTEGVRLNVELPPAPAICVVAVKPQMMGDALPALRALGNGSTVFLSIAAGTTLSIFEDAFGADSPIIRAMPNTPAAVGRGITALVGNDRITPDQMAMADRLLQAVGQTVHLTSERDMDAVTAVSGSGPAYVFLLIETLAAAGEAQGLTPDLALALAKATVAGSGALAEVADETPSQLRVNVTSPNGTTQAALDVLMDADTGLSQLMARAVKAAADRSRELAG